jgi:hypothetical protein
VAELVEQGVRGVAMAETIEKLRSLSTEEIIQRHDARASNTVVGTRHYLAELARRDAEAQGKRMEALTRSMNRLSLVGVAVTIVGVILATLTYFSV